MTSEAPGEVFEAKVAQGTQACLAQTKFSKILRNFTILKILGATHENFEQIFIQNFHFSDFCFSHHNSQIYTFSQTQINLY